MIRKQLDNIYYYEEDHFGLIHRTESVSVISVVGTVT